jgi:hypothetical protein
VQAFFWLQALPAITNSHAWHFGRFGCKTEVTSKKQASFGVDRSCFAIEKRPNAYPYESFNFCSLNF